MRYKFILKVIRGKGIAKWNKKQTPALEWYKKKGSPYHREGVSLNPNDATVVCSWESREHNWPWSLVGRDGIHLSPVNHSDASTYESSCVKKRADRVFPKCVMLPSDAA